MSASGGAIRTVVLTGILLGCIIECGFLAAERWLFPQAAKAYTEIRLGDSRDDVANILRRNRVRCWPVELADEFGTAQGCRFVDPQRWYDVYFDASTHTVRAKSFSRNSHLRVQSRLWLLDLALM